MNDFPSLPYSNDRAITPSTGGRFLVTGMDGTAFGRILHDDVFDMFIPYVAITSSEKDQISNFYLANRNAQFRWTDDITSETYVCDWLAQPTEVRVTGGAGDLWTVTFSATGRKE